MTLIKPRLATAWVIIVALVAALLLTFTVNLAPANAAVRSCTSSTATANRPILYYGDTGSCVKEAQRLLVIRLGANLAIDGQFGNGTRAAVKTYQKNTGVDQTGNVGPKTWSKLMSGSGYSNCWNSTSMVNISFDDTANNTALDSILATLKKKNVKATFFFNTNTTSLAKFKKIRAAGHNVGNHTYSHPNLTTLTTSGVKSQITRGRTDYTNTKQVRPPYGATNTTVRNAITSLGYKECLWTVDTMDWSASASPSAASIVKRVKYGDVWSPQPVNKGGMVLMHGTGKYTPAALPGVIDAIRDLGYKLPKLS